MVPTSTRPARWESKKNGTYLHFCFKIKFLQSPAPSAHALKKANKSSYMTQELFKLLPLGVSASVHRLLLRIEFRISTALLELSYAEAFWELIFPVQVPRVGMSNVGLEIPCSPGRTSTFVISLLLKGYHTGGVIPDCIISLCPLLPISSGFFFISLVVD